MSKNTKAFYEAAGVVGGFIRSVPSKIKGTLAENQRKNLLANREMNKRYPAGWSQNEFHMQEVMEIKKRLK